MDAVESDEILITESLAGGRGAFAKLVERYQHLVCALTFSATGSKALSEELAQETFLAAWRGLSELREPTHFRAWICSIARNLGRNARRDRARELSTDVLPDVPEDANLCEMLGEREEATLVMRVVSGLPETYREPLVLFYREGKSTAAVAQALGISIAATEQRLSRGRRLLKDNVAAIVERSLTCSRPGAGFVATVIATLGVASPATASAATGTAVFASKTSVSSGTRMVMGIVWKTAMVGITATAVVRGCSMGGEDADDEDRGLAKPVAAKVVDEAPVASPTSLAAETRIDAIERREHPARSHERPTLPRYELTAIAPNFVAVKLGGGRSEVWRLSEDEEPGPVVRTISGRVIDDDGAPCAGAVVLAGKSLDYSLGDSLVGESGTTTNAEGRFALSVHHEHGVSIVAMHERGWSELTSVGISADDASLELRVGPPARIHGTLRRNDEAVRPKVRLNAQGFDMSVEGDADGRFSIATVPPGRYRISIQRATDLATEVGSERSVSETIDALAGQTVRWDAIIEGGPTMAILPLVPDGIEYQQIEYLKITGAVAPKSYADAMTSLGPDTSWTMLGGDNLYDLMEWRDLEPGRTTFCVHIKRPGPSFVDGTDLGFGCTTVDVQPSVDVREVEVEVKPTGA